MQKWQSQLENRVSSFREEYSMFGEIGILLPKLFWPTVRKKYSSDWETLAKILRSLEQFIQTLKGQNNFW